MNTLTLKISADQEQALLQMSKQAHLSKSELVRRAIAAYIGQRNASSPFVSALDQAGDLVGCFSGGPADLSSNPRHLDGFGAVLWRSRNLTHLCSPGADPPNAQLLAAW